jgi:hypothetical protein
MRIILTALFLSMALNAATVRAAEWSQYKSAHFIVLHRDVPLSFVKSVADSAENYYREITSNLGFNREQNWMSEERAKIYIYENDRDYVRNAKQYQWSHGAASVRDRTIRTFPAAHGFFDSTLPHELGHIIFHEYIGFDVEIPLWFEEGVAMFQERAQRVGAHETVAKALKNGQFIPLTQLTNMRLYSDTPTEEVQLFYAESASVVNYLISELGEHRFVKLCRELKSGRNFMEALGSSYGRFSSIEDLNRAWVNYLKSHE